MKNLINIMNMKGVTSSALAHAIGISKVAMSNIVTEKSTPGIDKVEKMAQYLGVTVSELIGEINNKSDVVHCPHCGKTLNVKIE